MARVSVRGAEALAPVSERVANLIVQARVRSRLDLQKRSVRHQSACCVAPRSAGNGRLGIAVHAVGRVSLRKASCEDGGPVGESAGPTVTPRMQPFQPLSQPIESSLVGFEVLLSGGLLVQSPLQSLGRPEDPI